MENVSKRHHFHSRKYNSPKLVRRHGSQQHCMIKVVEVYQVCDTVITTSLFADHTYDFFLNRRLSLRPTQEELEEKNILHRKY